MYVIMIVYDNYYYYYVNHHGDIHSGDEHDDDISDVRYLNADCDDYDDYIKDGVAINYGKQSLIMIVCIVV